METYAKNNFISMRSSDDVLFSKNDRDEVVAHLDGYIIVPKEDLPDIEQLLARGAAGGDQ